MLLRLLRRLLRRPPKPKPKRGRKGDEIVYPTDRFTEDMQPKK